MTKGAIVAAKPLTAWSSGAKGRRSTCTTACMMRSCRAACSGVNSVGAKLRLGIFHRAGEFLRQRLPYRRIASAALEQRPRRKCAVGDGFEAMDPRWHVGKAFMLTLVHKHQFVAAEDHQDGVGGAQHFGARLGINSTRVVIEPRQGGAPIRPRWRARSVTKT